MSREIVVYLSGGNSNTDPQLSLGGIRSTTEPVAMLPTWNDLSIAGVTLVDAVNFSFVQLTYGLTGEFLSISHEDDGGYGQQINVGSDGIYTLSNQTEERVLTVSVINASLPTGNITKRVDAVNIMHNLFDLVTSENSKIGDVNYRHLYFRNETGAAMQILIFIQKQLNGIDYMEVGFENTTSGIQDTLMPDENSPPAGLSFASPTSAVEATVLTVAPNQQVGCFFKRTVLALTDVSTAVDTAIFQVAKFV